MLNMAEFFVERFIRRPIDDARMLIDTYGLWSMLGIVLGFIVLIAISEYINSGSSRLVKRMMVVLLLLVIGLTVASIVMTA